MGKKKNESKTNSTTETSPWAPAQGQLKDILNLAKEQFEKTGGLDGNWFDRELPDLSPDMREALSSMAESGKLGDVASKLDQMTDSGMQNTDLASKGLGQLAQGGISVEDITGLASQLYDNKLVDSQKEQLAKDINKQYEGQVHGLNQQAGATGNMGSSRAGVTQGVMAGKANEAMARGGAEIENAARQNAYNQSLATLQGNQGTNLAASQGLGQLGMGQTGLGATSGNLYQQMLGNKLNAAGIDQSRQDQQAANNWFNQMGNANAGWDNLSKYLGMTGAIGGMGGTSHTQGTVSQGGGGGMMGGLNTALGIGSTIAGMGGQGGFGWWSDASMKKKVKKKGKTKGGVSKYDWEWNEKGKERGMKGKASGVLAQQVEKEKPGSSKADTKSGALMVDYDKAGVKPSNSKKKK